MADRGTGRSVGLLKDGLWCTVPTIPTSVLTITAVALKVDENYKVVLLSVSNVSGNTGELYHTSRNLTST